MKYIIKESQHKFLIEQKIPMRLRRRYNSSNMEKYIESAESNYPTLCDDFGDEFQYADNVISDAVDDFFDSNEVFFEEGRFDEFQEMLIEICKEDFGERLFEAYRTTCREYTEMMFESQDKKITIDELIYNFLDSNLTPFDGWSNPKYYRKGVDMDDEIFLFLVQSEGYGEDPHMWYSVCDNNNFDSPIPEGECPVVTIPSAKFESLNGFFGDMWKPIFPKWFYSHTKLPIVKVESQNW